MTRNNAWTAAIALGLTACAMGTRQYDEPTKRKDAGSLETAPKDAGADASTVPASTQVVVNDGILEPLAEVTPVSGERWRGFNLIGMYALQWPDTNMGFQEKSFSTIAELGFNFVRLPLDYRTYTKPTNWLSFEDATVARLDKAVLWGQKYGVHVNLCLHRAPGYCVHDWAGKIVTLPPAQDLDLWTDEAAQLAYIEHWQMLALRYRDIDAGHLSFNLINEPNNVADSTYVALMIRTIQAIREISPERGIVVDGLETAKRVIEDVDFQALPNVAQSRHCYDFPKFQFYSSDFTPGSDQWPVPHWPPLMLVQYLPGGYHRSESLNGPLVIEGSFPSGTEGSIHVNQVSVKATLSIKTDGEELLNKTFLPGPNDPEAKTIYENPAYAIYQNTYDRDYAVIVNQPATQIALENLGNDTDWLSFNSLTIRVGDKSTLLAPTLEWGVPPARYRLDNGAATLVSYPSGSERFYDLNQYLSDWKALAATGKPVMIGEVLQSNRAPHADALRFADFMLGTFKSANFGWAVWDFDSTNPAGGGGFFNNANGRSDVVTENYKGYELDRAMLEVFQAN